MKRSNDAASGELPSRASLIQACDEAIARASAALAALDPQAPAARELQRLREQLVRLGRGVGAIESRYRSLLDAVPDAVTVHDRQGRVLDANRTAEQVYGYPLEELRKLSVNDLNPDLPPDHMDEVWRTFRLGQTVTVEAQNTRRDGTRFPVEVHSNAFEDGNEKRIVAVARDITVRKQAEFALQSSEQSYRLLLETVDTGVVVIDAQDRIVAANPAAAAMFGLARGAMEQRQMRPEGWTVVDEAGRRIGPGQLPHQRAFSTRAAIPTTLVGYARPGEAGLRWVTCSVVPQFLPGHAVPFQVFCFFTDVTEPHRQSQLFRQVQALASIGAWEHYFDGGLVWTEEVHRLLDVAEGTAPDWPLMLSRFGASGADRLQEAVAELRRSGASFDLELRLAATRGQRRWARVIGRPLQYGGNAMGLTGTIQDVTVRRIQEEQLRRQALTDPLTGLANRDALLRTLTRTIDDALPGAGPALLYIDLDRFKVINDLLGHPAGDGLLIAAAQRLKDLAGGDAMVARFGGDEFMVTLPGGAAGGAAAALADRITNAFARPFTYAGEDFTITASVGLARYPDDGNSIQQLINHADVAMFEAKRRGRNKWQPFSPELARSLTERLLIETQLRRALDNNEFHLVYQPQVDLASGRTVGAEALLRWRNRVLGEPAPGVFIAHAENTGDIVRIGAWVLQEACRQVRAWHDAGIAIPRLAVNVSYRQFLSESLPEIVADALAEAGLPGESLELEVTERVLVDDVPDALRTFEALKDLGVRLVIDDFGEGYSALNYLRQLPFDGLKISHTFMQGIPRNAADSAICEAVIRIAQSLGLIVTAEGVETEQQRAFLLLNGASLAQGFLFSRPVSPDDLAEYARRNPPMLP